MHINLLERIDPLLSDNFGRVLFGFHLLQHSGYLLVHAASFPQRLFCSYSRPEANQNLKIYS